MPTSFRLTLFVGLVGCAGLLLGSSVTLAQGGPSITPRQCGMCHAEDYRHWRRSGHAIAFEGEAFQNAWERQRRSSDCLACHATRYDAETGALAYAGVGCLACHQPTDHEPENPEGREHAVMSIPQDEADCATCHGADHARTYTEWEASPHNGPRLVGCQDCHDAHRGGLAAGDVVSLCGGCHFEPVPTVSPHMHGNPNCTDCHAAQVSIDNVHMHGGPEAVADCADCHMVRHWDSRGLFLAQTGHSMAVSLQACVNCHGEMHDLQPGEAAP